MKGQVENIIIGVASVIFTLYHAILTHMVVVGNAEESYSFIYVFFVEMAAFIPLGAVMLFLKRISRRQPSFFTNISGRNLVLHGSLLVAIFFFHTFWQSGANSLFFGQKFTRSVLIQDFFVFSKMRFLVYLTISGIFASLIKLKEYQEIKVKGSELNVQLQKAKLREVELKLNPEIIYPNLAFIREHTLEKQEEASQMVILMAGLLRKLVDSLEDDKIKLSEESEIFRMYTDVCRLKLQRFIEVDIHIDQQLSDKQVPSMILLIPFIEELLFGEFASFSKEFQRFVYSATKNSEGYFQITLELHGIEVNEEICEVLPVKAKKNNRTEKLKLLEDLDGYELSANSTNNALLLYLTEQVRVEAVV